MVEYLKRLLLAIMMVIILSLLIIGSKQSIAKAEGNETNILHWIWPADGVITDTFGTRNGEHKGVDIAENPGTPVYAVDQGKISKSYYSDSYGHVVFIKHDNGYETVYAHLQERKVQEGQTVQMGQMIGLMGNTGKSSGPHLHFEVHKNEWTVSKENSIDPFSIFGTEDIGQYVSAGEKYLEPILEVAKEINTNLQVHTVQSGETLWSIAEKYQTSISHIKELNQLQSETILPGQKLSIDQNQEEIYKVKKGDILSSIAQNFGVSLEKLKQINGMQSDQIYPEQQIYIQSK